MNAPVPFKPQNAVIPLQELGEMASAIAQSGLFGIKEPKQALALMLVAQAEGQHPAIVARDYDIIEGRPAKKSEAMLRSFLSNGGKVEWHQLDDTRGDATFSHPQGGSVRIVWDMERAKVAGLAGKGMWTKYRRQMLRARTISEGVRTVHPGSTSGYYTPEEIIDMGEAEIVEPKAATVEMPRSTKVQEPPAQQPTASSSPADTTGQSQPSAGAAPTNTSNGESAKPISAGALAALRRRLKDTTRTDLDACAKFGLSKIEDMTFGQFQDCMKWLNTAGAAA